MFENSKIRIGIAPINWTNDDMPVLGAENNFAQILSEAALAGYEGTEIGVNFPLDAAEIRYNINLRRMKIASKWTGVHLAAGEYAQEERLFRREIDFLKSVGADCINVCDMSCNLFRSDQSMFENKPTLSDKEWKKLCAGLDEFGRIACREKIKLCYHHHMGTVVQTLAEITYLLAHTNPKYVHLCLDTADLVLAGIEPASFVRRFGRRIAHVHLKDLYSEKMAQAKKENYSFRDAVKNNCFTVPGDGSGYMNFPEFFAALSEAGYNGWLIVEAEQNPALANPFEYALKARYYLSAALDL